MNFEVEQKFVAKQLDDLAEHLSRLGAEWSAPITQVDTYFRHPARDFAETDEALRIRQVSDESFITYKGPKIDATTKTRREIDIPLPVGAATVERFVALLEALGFERVTQVRKVRRIGKVPWQGLLIEAALDQVDGLGTFAELEALAESETVDDARKCIQSLAQELRLTENERRSYLELLLES